MRLHDSNQVLELRLAAFRLGLPSAQERSRTTEPLWRKQEPQRALREVDDPEPQKPAGET
jgi:hypothetical protein